MALSSTINNAFLSGPPEPGAVQKRRVVFRDGDEQDRPSSFDQIVQSWDTAITPAELAVYSACTSWGIKGSHFYLLNVLRKKLAYPGLKRAAGGGWRLPVLAGEIVDADGCAYLFEGFKRFTRAGAASRTSVAAPRVSGLSYSWR